MTAVLEIIAGIAILLAGITFLLTAVALWRAPDALTRANLLGPATGVALPLIIAAKLIYDGAHGQFTWGNLIISLAAIAALYAVLAIGSFVMGRALFGITPSMRPYDDSAIPAKGSGKK